MKPETKKRIKIQFLIFVILFLIAEIVLRIFGMRAGTLIDELKIEDNPHYMPRFLCDEMGINYLDPKGTTFMLGTVINKQGFRGKFDYTPASVDSVRKYTKRKIIMLVGDSYVEGCCADTVTNSFPDVLGRSPKYEVLNFGVSGTDPLQYELVTRKYLKALKPDHLFVAIYFGNDFLTVTREPNPGSPLTFPFHKNKWIYGLANSNLSKKSNYCFKTPEEAYSFFIKHYTMRGPNRNWFQKTLSHSVIISKLYLFTEHYLKTKEYQRMNPGMVIDFYSITYANIKNIKACCDSVNIPCTFVGIPAPKESEEGASLNTKYNLHFKDIPYYVPANLTCEDYDGKSAANHFNNKGHKKYADFLIKLLDDKK